jgi:hypothetical protein
MQVDRGEPWFSLPHVHVRVHRRESWRDDYVIRVVLNPAIRDYNVSKYVSSSRSLVVLPYITEATDETSPLMLARGTAREERSRLFVRTVRVLS